MKQLIKKSVFSLLVLGLAFTYACKEKTTTDPTPTKTLKKELLYNKTWYAKSGHKHKFNSDGSYKTSGNWQWLNGSDSMEVQEIPNDNKYEWYFKYCTENEMACALGSSAAARDNYTLYKDTPW